jgi:hypothetical protein
MYQQHERQQLSSSFVLSFSCEQNIERIHIENPDRLEANSIEQQTMNCVSSLEALKSSYVSSSLKGKG